MPRALVLAAFALIVLAGCGGRDGSWSREKAPKADNGEGVSLRVRRFTAHKDEIEVTFEVANDGDQPITFGVEPFVGHVVHDTDVENPGATTWLEAGGRRVAFYTVGKAGSYDYAAKVNVVKTMAAGYASKRIGVAPHKVEHLALKFLPHPKLDTVKAPLALVVSDVKRGDAALKPLRVDIK